jgi:hypothetical protein
MSMPLWTGSNSCGSSHLLPQAERRCGGRGCSRCRASLAPRRGGPICAVGGEEPEPIMKSPTSGGGGRGGRRWKRKCYISKLAAVAGATATGDFFDAVKNSEAAGDCLCFGTPKSWVP